MSPSLRKCAYSERKGPREDESAETWRISRRPSRRTSSRSRPCRRASRLSFPSLPSLGCVWRRCWGCVSGWVALVIFRLLRPLVLRLVGRAQLLVVLRLRLADLLGDHERADGHGRRLQAASDRADVREVRARQQHLRQRHGDRAVHRFRLAEIERVALARRAGGRDEIDDILQQLRTGRIFGVVIGADVERDRHGIDGRRVRRRTIAARGRGCRGLGRRGEAREARTGTGSRRRAPRVRPATAREEHAAGSYERCYTRTPRASAPGRQPGRLRRSHDGEVQVWRLRVDLEGHARAAATAIAEAVTADERDRAARFRQEADRQRFLHGRLLLRTFLGHHLGIAPRDVSFVNGEFGKPEVQRQADAAQARLAIQPRAFRRVAAVRARARSRTRRRRRAAPHHERRDRYRAQVLRAARSRGPRSARSRAAPRHLLPRLDAQGSHRQGHGPGHLRRTRSLRRVARCARRAVTLRGLDGDPAWDRWTIRGLDMPPNYTAAVAFDHRDGDGGEAAVTITRYEWTPW